MVVSGVHFRSGLLAVCWALRLSVAAAEEIPCSLNPTTAHQLTIEKAEDGSWKIRTVGADPYIFTTVLEENAMKDGRTILDFSYFSVEGTDYFQVFLNPPCSQQSSVMGAGLAPIQGWGSRAIDMSPVYQKGAPPKSLRLDFGSVPGRLIRLRGIKLRAINLEEAALRQRAEEMAKKEAALTESLRDYLTAKFSSQVTRVSVGQDSIVIEGQMATGPQGVKLVEVPLEREPYREIDPAMLHPMVIGAGGQFRVEIPRRAENGRDRLFSRWALATVNGEKSAWISHAHHADAVAAISTMPDEQPKGRKGLGGFHSGAPLQDVADLGVGSVTVNLLLGHLLYLSPGDGRAPFVYGGRTWYVSESALAGYDATMRAATDRGLIVSAILLVPQANQFGDREVGKLMAYPGADPEGVYTMPNLTTAEGVNAYATAIECLAQRYCRPDKRYGRIHHWIMHNEVNSGWFWTNAGKKSVERYTELYLRSMRMVHLIARQRDPFSKVFVSLEHHWTATYGAHGFQGRKMLELVHDFCRAEGDFEWALAYHPYPSNLFDPRSWNDPDATLSFDTPKITFKNLEVLEAWMRRPEMQFNGQVRMIHLTEQGTNARDYSPGALEEQAAGMAYAWNKLAPLTSIKVFHYHAWVDHRDEGGLRIGLRKFPDEVGDPLGKKPVWEIYRALDTRDQAAVTEFAKPMIGIKDWSEVHASQKVR